MAPTYLEYTDQQTENDIREAEARDHEKRTSEPQE